MLRPANAALGVQSVAEECNPLCDLVQISVSAESPGLSQGATKKGRKTQGHGVISAESGVVVCDVLPKGVDDRRQSILCLSCGAVPSVHAEVECECASP